MTNPPWPPPSGAPATQTGWYRADDGEWYASSIPPAPGYELGPDRVWRPSIADDDAWRYSRWGFGDFWWGVLAYLVLAVAASLGVAAIIASNTGEPIEEVEFGTYATTALVLISAIGMFGVPWLASRRKGLASLACDFGLRARPLDPLIGIGFGVAALIGAALAGTGLDRALDVSERTSNIPVDSLGSSAERAMFVFAIAIVTPIVEELFFRGLVHRSFLKRGSGAAFSAVSTTLIFVVPHLPSAETWENAISLAGSIAVLGAAFHTACHLTGNRLAAPIVAHMVVNGVASLALFV